MDTLKLNLGVKPTSDPDRFGVIGGDNAGFPNGRRLEDDVVDIDLQLVAGILMDNPVPLGDGVDRNDKPFLSQFPYLAAPDSGFDSRPSYRSEPHHAPVPPGGVSQRGNDRRRGRSAARGAPSPAPPSTEKG